MHLSLGVSEISVATVSPPDWFCSLHCEMEQKKRETLSDDVVSLLSQETKTWAEGHGIVMYSKKDLKLIHAPFTLLPSPIPSNLFQRAVKLAVPFNTIVDKLASHPTFLLEALKGFLFSLVSLLNSS